ncbi:hypothetical protein X777_06496 [Ooceraea biroi]|uniref:Uncharacterized protein n=1 Tax=Ooceraea biroi TaxID=2015173 RepID=A0A026WBI0_OOCBI|nr:hypothetical protein X777_06496 [Ooceraea biroi]
MKIHASMWRGNRKQRDSMINFDWLYRLIGVQVKMIVVLVTFLRHISLLNRGRVNAQSVMKGTGSHVSATGMSMLRRKKYTSLN